MNQMIAETWVRAAVGARIQTMQTQAMAKTRRWSNTLVADHLKHSTQNIANACVATPRSLPPGGMTHRGWAQQHKVSVVLILTGDILVCQKLFKSYHCVELHPLLTWAPCTDLMQHSEV